MYGRRVSKTHPRVEACGAVDELNAALGLARATAKTGPARDHLLAIQKDLVALMGELATVTEDLPRYTKDGFALLDNQKTSKLETIIHEIEPKIEIKGWIMPGGTLHSAALDTARGACRRAERCVCGLQESGELSNAEILVYLNRLADLLWLMARLAEAESV